VLKYIATKNIFDDESKDPNASLFIWCVLYNRPEMAKTILQLVKVLFILKIIKNN
jgi:hypothetical protein